MAKRVLLVLALLVGCGKGGVLGGGPGAGGTGGAAGRPGTGTGGSASCAGAVPFYCLTDCRSDIAWPATCAGGVWVCEALTPIRSTSCTCIGFPPPGHVCGDGGWVQVDGGVDGNAGAGGAGGGGGLGGAGGGGGAAGQGGIGGIDGGADAATCSGSAGFICLFNSCQNDIAAPATCKNGAWACPSGTVACSGGCTGNPPPGWVCVGGVWARPDAGSDAVDAGTLTYVDHIQPILRGTCGSCHATNSPSPGSSIPFVDSYAVTQRASMSPTYYGCPGESVGACINRAAEIQQLEGSNCRTFDRPFHRDGFDRCITDAERALIAAWVAGGMIER